MVITEWYPVKLEKGQIPDYFTNLWYVNIEQGNGQYRAMKNPWPWITKDYQAVMGSMRENKDVGKVEGHSGGEVQLTLPINPIKVNINVLFDLNFSFGGDIFCLFVCFVSVWFGVVWHLGHTG